MAERWLQTSTVLLGLHDFHKDGDRLPIYIRINSTGLYEAGTRGDEVMMVLSAVIYGTTKSKSCVVTEGEGGRKDEDP